MSDLDDLMTPTPEMYSDAGDQAVYALCDDLEKAVNHDRITSEEEFRKELHLAITKVARTHGEIWDTEPRWYISKRLTQTLTTPRQWQPVDL